MDRQDDSNVLGIVDGQNLLYILLYVRRANHPSSLLTRDLLDSLRETPRKTPCRLLARDSSRETSQGGRRTQQPTRRQRWRRATMMATTTMMATGNDNNDGDGQPFVPHKRFLGLLARDSLRETPCKRLLARLLASDFYQETPCESLLGAGGERNNQP